MNYKWLVLVLFFVCFNIQAETLYSGTIVPVRLMNNVNADMDMTGETVFFDVTENIIVNGKVLIPKGQIVRGFIDEAIGRKSLGKGGKLTLKPRSLTLNSGMVIRFEKTPLSYEGRKRTGATVAHVVMWGPLGLFAKGRAAFMFRDTEFDLVVDKDYEIPEYKQNNLEHIDYKPLTARFEKYKKKINYRKGKIGKNFKLIVEEPENFSINDFKIIGVDGMKLPEPIFPINIEKNKKNNPGMVLVFAFEDILKYAVPNITTFTFIVGDYKGTATLKTDWKLK